MREICDWCGGTKVRWTDDKRPTNEPCDHCNGTGYQEEK